VPISVRVEAERGYTVVRPAGRITLPALPELRTTIEKALRDQGVALVDLGAVRYADPILTAVFAAALRHCGGWPWAKLAIFGTNAEVAGVLARTTVDQMVPVRPTEAEALAGTAQRPRRVQRTVALPRGPHAPADARAATEAACLAWHVPAGVREAAVLIASELVTNAVRHAGTGTRLTVACGPRTLKVAVTDFAPQRAVRPRPAGAPPFGGLAVVSALARYWGVRDEPDGKTVWARLPLAPAPRVR
jgi:anti-anti-sigma factor